MVRMNDNEAVANLNQNVTATVRMLMGRRGMTQTDLAKVLDIDKALVSRSFAGARIWRLEEIAGMARHFNVDPDLFLRDPDDLIPARIAAVTHGYTQHSAAVTPIRRTILKAA